MQLKVELQGKDELLRKLSAQVQQQILANVLNELARESKDMVKENIVDKYNYKDVQINFSKLAAPYTLKAVLSASKKRIPLDEFDPQGSRSGVSVEIIRGKRKNVKGAFISTPSGKVYPGQSKPMTSSTPMVFKRAGKEAYPLKRPTTIGVGARMTQQKKNINDLINRKFNNVFMAEFFKN